MLKCAYLDGIKSYLTRGAEVAGDVVTGKGTSSASDLVKYLTLTGGLGAAAGVGSNLLGRLDEDAEMSQTPDGRWVMKKKKSPSLLGSAVKGGLKGGLYGLAGAGVSNMVNDMNTPAPTHDSPSLLQRMGIKQAGTLPPYKHIPRTGMDGANPTYKELQEDKLARAKVLLTRPEISELSSTVESTPFTERKWSQGPLSDYQSRQAMNNTRAKPPLKGFPYTSGPETPSSEHIVEYAGLRKNAATQEPAKLGDILSSYNMNPGSYEASDLLKFLAATGGVGAVAGLGANAIGRLKGPGYDEKGRPKKPKSFLRAGIEGGLLGAGVGAAGAGAMHATGMQQRPEETAVWDVMNALRR